MNIVRAFEHYCLRNDFPPVSAEEQVALDAYTVWLIQRGLLSKTEIAVERVSTGSQRYRVAAQLDIQSAPERRASTTYDDS